MSKRPAWVRLDRVLVARGLAADRDDAHAQIAAGIIEVDGMIARSPTAQVRPEPSVRVVSGPDWVSRGAFKLDGVLDPLGVSPSGLVCADLGASTGGFTDVLLRRGAQRVYAIDVGRGLLDWRLVQDARVVNLEATNARELTSLPDPIGLIVGDLSFISLGLILPAVRRLLAPGGDAVLMVKPQFEAARADIAPGGKVSDEARAGAILRVRADADQAGFDVVQAIDSPLPGARAGNVEHFLHLRPR